MRGASFLVAVILAAEIGDVRRFWTPLQLMAFPGLVPGERSTGATARRSSLTCRQSTRPPRLGRSGLDLPLSPPGQRGSEVRLEGLAQPVRDVRRPDFAPAFVVSVLPARSRRSSWPRSRAKWPPFCGPSAETLHRHSGVDPVRCTALEAGPRWETPVASCVAEPMRPTPAL
nr:transposase [Ensifer sp. LCM 4579]